MQKTCTGRKLIKRGLKMELKNILALHASAKRDNAQQKKAESHTNFIYLQSVGQQLTIVSVLDTIENLVLEHTIITDIVADFSVKVEVIDIKKITKLLKNDTYISAYNEHQLCLKTGKKELKIACTTTIYDNIAVVSDNLISSDTETLLNYQPSFILEKIYIFNICEKF